LRQYETIISPNAEVYSGILLPHLIQPLVDLKFISTHRHNLNFHLTSDKIVSTSSLSSAATQLTYETLCCCNEESSAENRTQEYGKSNGLTFHHTVHNLQHVRAVLGNDALQPSYVLDMG
jgi:hypothetical protein